MGTPRSRSRNFTTCAPGTYETGFYNSSGVWVHVTDTVGSSIYNIDETCNDTLAPYPFVEPHGLTLIKRECTPLQLNGEVTLSSSNVRRHSNFTVPSFRGAIYVPAPPNPDMNWWTAKALAAINPFQSEVDVPLFLFELREFPRMLRDLGRVIRRELKPKDVPGGYLAYNFGWAPLLGDLGKLIDLGESLSKTRKRLQDAANGRRIRRSLGTISAPGLPYDFSFSFGTSGNYVLQVATENKMKAWTTAKVSLTEPLPDGQDLEWEVLRTTLNLQLSADTIWEAIPWSFLIDYFVNIGNLIEARRGFNRWRFSNMYVMVTSTKTEYVCSTKRQVGSMSYLGGRRTYVKKQRSYIGSDPNVGFGLTPFLSGYQLGIIGALATASALRKI